jgi:TonB family protein
VYQSIDDPQEDLDALERGDKRMFIWLFTALWLGLVFAIVYWTSPGPAASAPQDDSLRAEQATYRKAVSEMAAPMRRARLQDFTMTYPESHYLPSVEVQLDVINAYEAQKWTETTDIIFAPKTTRQEKLATLDAFEAEWGGSLLGGRDDEIRELRKDILQTEDVAKTPSRKLTDLKSPIPKTVPDTLLAGGPRPVTPPPTLIRPPEPTQEPQRVVELDVVQPTIRRSVTPRYPRKAMRRRVKASVTLKLNIDEKGKVAMTELVNVQASRYEKSFVKAAERAAMRTRFHPKTVGGVPQAATGVVKRYRFEP